MTTPRTEHVLQGPFHTRSEAARLAGITPAELAAIPGAVRLDGPMSLEEVYPGFQFEAAGGFLPGLPDVVSGLGVGGRDAAAWLVTPQPALGGRSALEWLCEKRPLQPLLDLAGAATA